MEECNSLDYLIPPVNKSQKTLRSNVLFSQDCQEQTDVKLVTNFRKKIKQITSPLNPYDFELHTSLLSLKKTTEEVIEQHSIFNLNNTNKCLEVTKDYRRNYTGINKPMIEVTVVPKVAESKVLNKSREKTKKLQSTVSNQENCIKSQNIYFTVKERRHDKVYKINATKSANLSKIVTTKYEDISTQQISNSKRLIDSLNMEKNKRKNKKNCKIHNSFGFSGHNRTNGNHIKNLNPRKSKVTIVGQLGLTSDDHYVLKCAATVNDKPITTNLVHINNNASANGTRQPTNAFVPNFKTTEYSIANKNNWKRFCPQDSYIHNVENRYSNLKHTTYRMASQGTQVNFNQVKNIKSKDFKGQVANCNCANAITVNVPNMEDNAVKGYESPLVIISVYPRNDREDKNVKIIRCPDVPKTQVVSNMEYNISKSRKGNPIKGDTFSLNKTEPKLVRRRSPSPASKSVHNKVLTSKTDDKIFKKNNGHNTSTRPLINKNASTERPRNVNKKKEKLSHMTKDESCDCYKPRNLSNLELLKHSVISNVGKKADTKEVKRALVNNFIKNIDKIQQHDSKILGPKDTSRISINIDSDRDRYDVLFEKRDFDTGLTIRKTLKKYSQRNIPENEIDFNSMENFLMLSDEMKGTNGTEIYSRDSCDLSNLLLRESRLNVRDSLELCYSHQGRVDSRLNPAAHTKGQYNLRETSSSTDLLAPVKHFRGDNCTIPDPNERDREIRELLGIVRNKRKTKTDIPFSTKARLPEIQREQGRCCQKKCSSKGLMTGLSMSKFFASKCLKRKNKKRILATQSTKRASEQAKEVKTQTFLNKKQETDVTKSHKVSNALAIGSIDKEHTNGTFDSSLAELLKDEIYKAMSRKGNNKNEENLVKVIEKESRKDDDENITTKKEEIDNLYEKAAYKETLASTGFPQGKADVTDIIRKKPVIGQNLILNRNIQVFLQVAQFTKQRPIILTRKQYNKVKKTIQCTISKNLSLEQRKRCSLRNCNVSIHEIKIKPRLQRFRYDRDVQTERSEIQRNVRCIYIQTPHRCKSQITKVGNSIKSKINHAKINKLKHTTDVNNDMRNENENHLKANEDLARQTVSSMEVRYANVKYMKHVTISSTQFGDGVHNTINYQKSQKHNHSIHTLFKGPRKCVTPNLGTSAYSLCSDVTDACSSIKSVKAPPCAGDPKPKKPFLQRLISCLVMRSAETSMLKEMPIRKPPSVNSSVDSYHISTSLGALEMTSSLYDTSASFYSNHTTRPLNKMKRGFFSSVRGFLKTRRS